MTPEETPKRMDDINRYLRREVHPSVELVRGVCSFAFVFGEYGLGPTDYGAMLLSERTAGDWAAYVHEALTGTLACCGVDSVEAFDARCRARGEAGRVRWA
jgi:hypothetical protein